MRSRGPDLANGYSLIHGHSAVPGLPVLMHVSEAVCLPTHQRQLHRHPVMELCYVLSGRGERITRGERSAVGPGDLYLIQPGEEHGARADATDPWHFFTIAFDARRVARDSGRRLDDETQRDLEQALAETWALDHEKGALERRVIHGGEGAEHIFRRILAELDRLEASRAKTALTALQVQALIIELLVFVTRCFIAQREQVTGDFRQRTPTRNEFQDLLAWLPTRLATPPALAEMAQRVGLAPAHFAVTFKREVGCTPIEHVTNLRVDAAARRLIDEPRTAIAAIAQDLGFCTPQYFSMVFRKTKGCPPREWRMRRGRPG
ncbi:MAG TPA: AraC family transcriptional regulator [Planctomycetota bacterium]|nr:AraC family transcriptional regulator [Planctomycetota bacterium]